MSTKLKSILGEDEYNRLVREARFSLYMGVSIVRMSKTDLLATLTHMAEVIDQYKLEDKARL